MATEIKPVAPVPVTDTVGNDDGGLGLIVTPVTDTLCTFVPKGSLNDFIKSPLSLCLIEAVSVLEPATPMTRSIVSLPP